MKRIVLIEETALPDIDTSAGNAIFKSALLESLAILHQDSHRVAEVSSEHMPRPSSLT
jgi:hypothetical protein